MFHAKLSVFDPIDTLMEVCENLNRLNLQDDAYHNVCVTSEGIQGALQLSATERKDKEGKHALAKRPADRDWALIWSSCMNIHLHTATNKLSGLFS